MSIKLPPIHDMPYGIKPVIIHGDDGPMFVEYRMYDVRKDETMARYDAIVNGMLRHVAPNADATQERLPELRAQAYEAFRKMEIDSWTTSPGAAKS